MIREMVENWYAHKEELKTFYQTSPQSEYQTYLDILRNVVRIICPKIDSETIKPENIISINGNSHENGGFEHFAIMFGSLNGNIITTSVNYGSCSSCDLLCAIHGVHGNDVPTQEQVDSYMTLSLHLVQKMNYIGRCGIPQTVYKRIFDPFLEEYNSEDADKVWLALMQVLVFSVDEDDFKFLENKDCFKLKLNEHPQSHNRGRWFKKDGNWYEFSVFSRINGYDAIKEIYENKPIPQNLHKFTVLIEDANEPHGWFHGHYGFYSYEYMEKVMETIPNDEDILSEDYRYRLELSVYKNF